MLTRRQKEFIRYYVITKNAREAAIQAGYSPRSADAQGRRLLRKDTICKEIERLLRKREEEYVLSREGYIKKTLDNFKEERHPSVRARYWEILGKAKGFLKEENIQNIAVFQQIAQELQSNFEKMRQNTANNASSARAEVVNFSSTTEPEGSQNQEVVENQEDSKN